MSYKLIVGLGNPGKKYERTRHNIGFRVIEALQKELAPVRKRKTRTAAVIECLRGEEKLVLAQPITFMNRSGEAVKALAGDYELEWPKGCLVISDDAELPLGKIRMREKGSAGGHRGLESIIEICGCSRFNRLRIGVGRPEDPAVPLEEYVLEKFSKEEEKDLVPEVLKKAATAILMWVERGSQAVMNQFN